jgi:MFS family permease
MPRVPRSRLIRLDGTPGDVAAAARELFGAAPAGDGSLRIDRAEAPGGTTFIRLQLDDAGDGATTLRIDTTVGLQLPYFGWFIRPLVRLSLRRVVRYVEAALTASLAGDPIPDPPPPASYLPVSAFDAEQAGQLATAAAATAVVGFASALVGQMADNVQSTFHVSNATLGLGLAITRFGALVALVVVAFADRAGRRRAILVGLLLSSGMSALSAVAPNFAVFTGAQTIERAAVIATGVVAVIAAIEDAPEGARAFATAMLGLAGGFGFSFAVVFLPVADLAPWAWRIAFAASGATLLFVPRIARHLAESTRYTRVARTDVERGRVGELLDNRYGRRFFILALTGFLLNVFAGPSSQLTNKYLQDVRHYSGTEIAAWRAVTTGIPGLLGLLAAGHLAEARGRRLVMRVGLVIGIATQIVVYLTPGIWMWLASTASAVAGAAGGVALGTMQVEMFPTEVRGTSNGLIVVMGVLGSAIGLSITGLLSESIGTGHALALCGTAALFAAMFVVHRLPESAQRRLDDVSPTEGVD